VAHVKVEYICPACGPFESDVRQDTLQCRCGKTAKRVYSVAINRTSLKSEARWDPVVGAYVENNRQFDYLLAQGAAVQEEKLGMESNLVKVDSRDTDALDSLHGYDPNERQHLKEQTEKVKHDAGVGP